MAQATDIVLNNAGYMVEPGSPSSPGYKRLQDGYPEGLTQRTSITDFFGGQGRTHQLERDTMYAGIAVRPALGGQGITPWTRLTVIDSTVTNISGTPPDALTHIPHVIIRDRLYFALGPTLYQGTSTSPGTITGWTQLKTYPNTITDITIYGSTGMLIAFGAAAEILHRNTITDAEVALFTGEYAHKIQAYAGYAIWIDARTPPDTPTIIRMVTGDGVLFRHVTHDAFDLVPVDGEIMLITKQALYTFSGRVRDVLIPNPGYDPDVTGSPTQMPGQEWSGEFEPFFQQGVYTQNNDFAFITGFGGRTIAWIAGGVHELVPSGDRAGWRSTGLAGRRCFGGTVASGYLITCIESHEGQNEIWAYDGNGWWRIATKAMPAEGALTNVWCNPVNIGKGHVYNNVAIFRHGSSTMELYRLDEHIHTTGSYITNYPSTDSEIVSPMIDTGDRDKIKAWRKIGAVFSSPELRGEFGTTDVVAVYLDYSIDGGASWVTGSGTSSASLTGNNLNNMNFELHRELQGVTSRFIQLRIRWQSTTSWAPILTGLWVEHEALSSPARRRKWQLKIHARDQEIDRDGVTLTRTGRALIEELWQAWETDTPLTFRDIDYDTDPTQRTVRIVGIAEVATQPFDHGIWGDSTITLNLVEV